jgi:hypothetical protein
MVRRTRVPRVAAFRVPATTALRPACPGRAYLYGHAACAAPTVHRCGFLPSVLWFTAAAQHFHHHLRSHSTARARWFVRLRAASAPRCACGSSTSPPPLLQRVTTAWLSTHTPRFVPLVLALYHHLHLLLHAHCTTTTPAFCVRSTTPMVYICAGSCTFAVNGRLPSTLIYVGSPTFCGFNIFCLRPVIAWDYVGSPVGAVRWFVWVVVLPDASLRWFLTICAGGQTLWWFPHRQVGPLAVWRFWLTVWAVLRAVALVVRTPFTAPPRFTAFALSPSPPLPHCLPHTPFTHLCGWLDPYTCGLRHIHAPPPSTGSTATTPPLPPRVGSAVAPHMPFAHWFAVCHS